MIKTVVRGPDLTRALAQHQRWVDTHAGDVDIVDGPRRMAKADLRPAPPLAADPPPADAPADPAARLLEDIRRLWRLGQAAPRTDWPAISREIRQCAERYRRLTGADLHLPVRRTGHG